MPPKKTRHGNLQTQVIEEETTVVEVTSVRATSNDQGPTHMNTEHVGVAMHTECEEPPNWWKQQAPRLQASDTLEHVQLVISRNFGAGVDMDRFLSPARLTLDSFTETDRELYKAKGFKVMKIPASWKKWTAMNTGQKSKFVNQLYALTAAHASLVEQSIAAASTVVAKELHDEVGKNRTMHEFARVIHVMSDSANLAGA